jgi:segregation and condensation protein A
MEDAYSIKVPVFEGPLDLLLHLIKENKIDIYDIPIALITRQYLQYIEMMKELNLDMAGEFLVMAATLIHIKSRMLLPVEETLGTEEPEDPRLELVERLLEYQAFKDAALGLREKEDEWLNIFRREPEKEEPEGEGGELYLFDLNIFDLIGAFRKIVEKTPSETITITREALTVKDKMSAIIEMLEDKETIRFEELFKGDATKAHLIVTFVALLEILRLGIARVYQEKDFGSIWVINPAKSSPSQSDNTETIGEENTSESVKEDIRD